MWSQHWASSCCIGHLNEAAQLQLQLIAGVHSTAQVRDLLSLTLNLPLAALGQPWLRAKHPPRLSLALSSHQDMEKLGRWGVRKLVGCDEDSEIAYQLLWQAKQAKQMWLDENYLLPSKTDAGKEKQKPQTLKYHLSSPLSQAQRHCFSQDSTPHPKQHRGWGLWS